MKVLFELSHPKHYYQFRYLIEYLHLKNAHTIIFIREKDLLRSILSHEKKDVIVLNKYPNKTFFKLLYIPIFFFRYLAITIRTKPDYIISKASPYAVLMKLFTRAKIVITPDSEVVKLTNRFVAPLSDLIITPKTFEINYQRNHYRIDGFFEETYLSPLVFRPEKSKLLNVGIKPDSTFFILRFVSWKANHDINQTGFTDIQKIRLVETLKHYGEVYISAENEKIPLSLIKDLIKIPSNLIHQLIFFSNLYVGDSQTMATEAALLGTPALRYNSFVGENDMSNFKILEKKGLAFSFSSFEKLLQRIHQILNDNESKLLWQEKRKNYFLNKADVNKQIIDILNI